jgi:hypothetical protein
MTRLHIYAVAISMALAACVVDNTAPSTSTTEQAGETMQGETMQGETMQGETMQGMTMQGMLLSSASLSDVPLTNVRVERGEVVAQQGTTTLRGTSLIDAHFYAQAQNTASPPATAIVEYRVTAIAPEDAKYDPTHTGNTYVYTLEQWVADTGKWQAACPADSDGRQVAIPLAAVWDQQGNRNESSTMFTFGCTTGVIAKCYRWGYRPWVSGYGDLTSMHWTCTRLARADYCGNGQPHTHDGTKINVWDTLPPPGPIQSHGGGLLQLPPPLMTFEAGWNTGGAVCLSRARWALDKGGLLAAACPQRLVPPGLGQTVCETVSDVLGYDANAKMFNESYLNVGL